MRPNTPTDTEIACPTCQRPMMIRTATTGVFLGCSGYQLPPKERCKTTINLTPGDEAIPEGEEAETARVDGEATLPNLPDRDELLFDRRNAETARLWE